MYLIFEGKSGLKICFRERLILLYFVGTCRKKQYTSDAPFNITNRILLIMIYTHCTTLDVI